MFKWVYKFAGKLMAKKIGLTEGTMDAKKWYLSKAVWSAILTALIGGVTGVSSAIGHPITVPQWVLDVLIGIGIYGLRTGDKPIA